MRGNPLSSELYTALLYSPEGLRGALRSFMIRLWSDSHQGNTIIVACSLSIISALAEGSFGFYQNTLARNLRAFR